MKSALAVVFFAGVHFAQTASIPAVEIVQRELAARQGCPDFQSTDPTVYLGPDPNGCNWKQWLTCGSIVLGCGAVCTDAAIMGGTNPFADAGCASCAGASAGVCGQCWDSNGGKGSLCTISGQDPDAACLNPFCYQPVQTS